MTNEQLQVQNQALLAMLQDCAQAFGEIHGGHSTDRETCSEMKRRIQAELARLAGKAQGSCGCDGLCRQRDLASDEVDQSCRAVHGVPQTDSTLSNEEQEAFADWYPLGCPGAGVTAELCSRAGFHAGAAWQRARAARAATTEHSPASKLDAEAGLEEWAAGKFRHGRFVAPLNGNTDWALARAVWSAALDFAGTHLAPVAEQSSGQGLELDSEKTYLVVDPLDNFHICYTVKSRELALSYADGGLVAFGPIEDIAQQALPSDDELARAAFERAHPAPQGVTFDAVLKQYMCGASGSLEERDAYQKLWKDWQAGAATQPATETLIRQLAAVRKQRDALMRQLNAGSTGKFRMGDSVRKTSGSEWAGLIVGWYSTENTPEGYAVESEAHKGSVQIYPAHALTAQGGSDE